MNIAEQAIEQVERRGWGQGVYEDAGGSLCLLGALARASGVEVLSEIELANRNGSFDSGVVALCSVLPPRRPGRHGAVWDEVTVSEWNDDPERTEAEVLEALRLASKELSK